MLKDPIIIIGMARSGTTLIANMLGYHDDVNVIVEPHILWKTGNFHIINDQEYCVKKRNIERIRKKIIYHAKGKRIVEKSPTNSLRANLVYSVFPNAKIIYLERDPVRLIASNYNRSIKKDSFKLSIILEKYFIRTGSEDLPYAISNIKLFDQLSFRDIPLFILYICRMFFLRNIINRLPFGPKIRGFNKIIKDQGLLDYHVKVYVESIKEKELFKELYKTNLFCFEMEELMRDRNQIKKLFESTELSYDDSLIDLIYNDIDKIRVKKSSEKNPIDDLIIERIDKYNV